MYAASSLIAPACKYVDTLAQIRPPPTLATILIENVTASENPWNPRKTAILFCFTIADGKFVWRSTIQCD